MHGFLVNVVFVFLINICYCVVWKKGVVHYTINKLDYDIHSQDVITSTLAELQQEICVKFFQLPPGTNHTADGKLLFITNPDKLKNCESNNYDFTTDVILMPIGYKCISEKPIARLVAEMLRASIEHTVSTINSYDLIKKFHEQDQLQHHKLLSAVDRNFINAHYHSECGALAQRVAHAGYRRQDDNEPEGLLTDDNLKYYENKLWPLGIVLYGVEERLRDTLNHVLLKHAMASVELSTCVVFVELSPDQPLKPKSLLWFAGEGEEVPRYGYQVGNQSIKLESMVHGAPGHSAHTLNNLLRVLGVHMMSNRFDRDNYVVVKWKNVITGKESLLDKAPRAAWLEHMAYDFDSATHAPGNYMCRACELGESTVQPVQDHLWQKTMSMGHKTELSGSDIQLLRILYGKQCQNRYVSDVNKEKKY